MQTKWSVAFTCVLVFGVYIYIVAPFFVSAPEDPPKQQEVTAQDEIVVEDEDVTKRRNEHYRTYLMAAESIAKQTEDPRAREVIAFLNEHGVLASPAKVNGLMSLQFQGEPSNDDPLRFAILFLFRKDAEFSVEWRDILLRPSAGDFFPGMTTLVLKEDECSDFWKGLILLHEGHHAFQYMSDPYSWEDVRIFCHKERETHEFENRLLLSLGGKRYRLLLDEHKQEIQSFLALEGGTYLTHVSDPRPYDARLDDVFGPAQSKLERNARATHVWIHAYFELFESSDMDRIEIQERQALFLKSTYSTQGIFPSN